MLSNLKPDDNHVNEIDEIVSSTILFKTESKQNYSFLGAFFTFKRVTDQALSRPNKGSKLCLISVDKKFLTKYPPNMLDIYIHQSKDTFPWGDRPQLLIAREKGKWDGRKNKYLFHREAKVKKVKKHLPLSVSNSTKFAPGFFCLKNNKPKEAYTYFNI